MDRGTCHHYRRALDIANRVGDQAAMGSSYHQLGNVAQARGDYDEAARLYQHALDIEERLGDQAGMASTYNQFGNLEAECGGAVDAAVVWHVKALAIRLRLGVPEAMNNLRPLGAHRRNLGPERFSDLPAQAGGDADLAETITSLLDQVDAADGTP